MGSYWEIHLKYQQEKEEKICELKIVMKIILIIMVTK